jgi:hypothetical protein
MLGTRTQDSWDCQLNVPYQFLCLVPKVEHRRDPRVICSHKMVVICETENSSRGKNSFVHEIQVVSYKHHEQDAQINLADDSPSQGCALGADLNDRLHNIIISRRAVFHVVRHLSGSSSGGSSQHRFGEEQGRFE